MSKITNRPNGLTRSGTVMLYSCTHMATVAVGGKGLIHGRDQLDQRDQPIVFERLC